MSDDDLIPRMTRRADALAERLGAAAAFELDDAAWRSWTYLPGERAGVALSDMGREEAKAALRLLAAGLPPHVFAQASTVMALEDVLDEASGGDRHRGDYWVAIFGIAGQPPWDWRLGGHHLSVRWMVAEDGTARATPQFLGANPARVRHGGSLILAPLFQEEHRAVGLVESLDTDQRRTATLDDDVPQDILTADAATVDDELEPAGVPVGDLGGAAASRAEELIGLYRDRVHGGLPEGATEDLRFAWSGGTAAGEPRYYRLQGASLVVELDNTQDGANHIHSVVRDRRGDLGDDVLRAHLHEAHPR